MWRWDSVSQICEISAFLRFLLGSFSHIYEEINRGNIWVVWKCIYSLLPSATYTILSSVEDFQEGGGVLVGENMRHRDLELGSVELLVWSLPLLSFYRYKRQIRTCSGHNNNKEHSLVKPSLQHHWACTPASVLAQHPKVCDAPGLTGQTAAALSTLPFREMEFEARMEGGWLYWPRNLVQAVLKCHRWESPARVNRLVFSKHFTYSVCAVCTWCDIIGYVLNVFMCCHESEPFLLSFISSENGIWELSWGSHAAALWVLWHDILVPSLWARGREHLQGLRVCLDVRLKIGFGACRLEFAAASLPFTMTYSSSPAHHHASLLDY